MLEERRQCNDIFKWGKNRCPTRNLHPVKYSPKVKAKQRYFSGNHWEELSQEKNDTKGSSLLKKKKKIIFSGNVGKK